MHGCAQSESGEGPGPSRRTSSSTVAALDELRQRPLLVPSLDPGQCEPTPSSHADPAFGPALGSGSVRPVGIVDGILTLTEESKDETTGWYRQKVLWIVQGPAGTQALIRGVSLSGGEELRFGEGTDVGPELLLTVNADPQSKWSDFPTITQVQSPGCYSYQIDTAEGSNVIVFDAQLAN